MDDPQKNFKLTAKLYESTTKKKRQNNITKKMNDRLTHAYVHRLADVHLAGFAPAFTLSLCDSEYARKPPVPIASGVSGQRPKFKHTKLSKDDYNSRITL